MLTRTPIHSAVAGLALAFAGLAYAQPPGNEGAVQRAGAVQLKDWKPKSSLAVPRTDIPKARFPVIDVHSHSYASTPEQVAEWVRTMDEVGVEKTVVLTGAVGARFDALVELYLKPYPERFVLFAGVLREGTGKPDYPQRAAAEVERCYRMGARGLGELSDKGTGFTRALSPSERLHPDDPRLDLFWKKAAELNMPANIHMADHPSAWEPPDHTQERPPGFQRFNQFDFNVPSHAGILAIRDRLLARHPGNKFIFCHLSNQGHDLASLTKTMDAYPNLYLDMSARLYELGRQPRHAAKFLSRYKDRVLFGTDRGRAAVTYRIFWQVLESADEYLPSQSWWMLYGLELPDETLRALYRENALRILNWEPVR
ncbi:MAG: amidohydrolase family protein [Bryobacteraceae bacterium]